MLPCSIKISSEHAPLFNKKAIKNPVYNKRGSLKEYMFKIPAAAAVLLLQRFS